MLRVRRYSIPLELLLAIEHLTAESLEIHLDAFCLRQHVAFFFLDVMPHTLSQDSELRVAVIIATTVAIELGYQNTGDVVFLVRLVHKVFSDMLSDNRVENLFLDQSMYLQFSQGLGNDLFLFRRRFGQPPHRDIRPVAFNRAEIIPPAA